MAIGFACVAALCVPATTARANQHQQNQQQQLQQQQQAVPVFAIDGPYLTQQLQSLSIWQIVPSVRDHVGEILVGGPTPFQPAMLGSQGMGASPSFLGFGKDEKRRSSSTATTSSTNWSVWVDGNLSWANRDDPIVGNDGTLGTLSIGLDRRVGSRGVIGVLFNGEDSDFDTTLTRGTMKTEGAGGGVYGGYALTNVLVIDGLALWKSLDTDVSDSLGRASFDTDRMQLAANLTAYLTPGSFTFRPTAGISFTRDDQDAYVDSRGLANRAQTTETVTGSAGAQLGRVFDLGNGRSVEPWMGLTLLVESFSTTPQPLVAGRELEPFDVIASAGLKMQLSQRASLALKADVGALARSDYDTVTGDAQFSFQF